MMIQPNQIVNLYVDLGHGMDAYRTRVEDIQENMISVAAPIELGQVVPIRIGSKVVLEYKDSTPSHQGRFTIAAIVETRKSDPVPMLGLRLAGRWEKTQDRMFVRVEVLLHAMYAPVVDGNVLTARPCLVRDMSGGGFWMEIHEKLAESSKLWVSLPLGSEAVQTFGRIVRIQPIGDEGDQFGVGVTFVGLEEKDRQVIIQYVYQRQLELRRKGLLAK